MDDDDLRQTLRGYGERELEQRRHWYAPVAEAYARTRPAYPQVLLRRVSAIAQLSCDSRILEVGCWPATATVDLARSGAAMVCLEPNPAFRRLAKERVRRFPRVEIRPEALEEWKPGPDRFDAVLAASSFHWIPQDVTSARSARALKERGFLILLWNRELQPTADVHRDLSGIYRRHAPGLDRREDREAQEKILRGLGRMIQPCGLFEELESGSVVCEVTYPVEDYLLLLSTYSPYLRLEPAQRQALFDGLRARIERDHGGRLRLSFLSAFQVARKR